MTQARPILFSGDMVRALLDGRKTMTRRAIKTNHHSVEERDDGTLWPWREDLENGGDIWYSCPYGQPGDVLWVRENTIEDPAGSVSFARYTADSATVRENGNCLATWWYSRASCPSIHMPRWASRLTLRITGVWVERLQEISEADALAEGVRTLEDAAKEGATWCDKPRRAFRFLWQSINGTESWDANPWVWVIEFEVIHANVDAALKQ